MVSIGKAMLQDTATLTGGKAITEDLGIVISPGYSLQNRY
jgi:hypothetical protein